MLKVKKSKLHLFVHERDHPYSSKATFSNRNLSTIDADSVSYFFIFLQCLCL